MAPREGQPRAQRLEPAAAEALASIAMAALWADGREHTSEQALVAVELGRLPALDAKGPEAVHAVIARARERYVEQGAEAAVQAAVQELDPPRREQALTLALDVLMVDRRVTEEEAGFLEELVRVLDVPPERIEEVIGVLEAKHGIGFDPEPAPGQPTEDPTREIPTQRAISAFALAAVRAAEKGCSGLEDSARDLGLQRGLAAMSDERREAMLEGIRAAFEREGVEAFLRRCAANLSPRAAERAFTWAADVALADRRLTEPEHAFLTDARELLGIAPDEAARIVDVLWKKHLR